MSHERFSSLYGTIYHSYNKPSRQMNFLVDEGQEIGKSSQILSMQNSLLKLPAPLTSSTAYQTARVGSASTATTTTTAIPMSLQNVQAQVTTSQTQSAQFFSYNQESENLKIVELTELKNERMFEQLKVRSLSFELREKKFANERTAAQQLQQLLRMLQNHPITLLQIDLERNAEFSDTGVQEALARLSKMSSLEHVVVRLSHCNITDYSLHCIAEQCRQLENLKTLTICVHSTHVTEEGVHKLFQNFANSGVSTDVQADPSVNVKKARLFLRRKPAVKLLDKEQQQQQQLAAQFDPNISAITNISTQDTSHHFTANGSGVLADNNSFQNRNAPTAKRKLINNQEKEYKNPFHEQIVKQTQLKEEQQSKSVQEQIAEKHFEQEYGKGFKLLQSFGYRIGKGLGKNNEGIVEPLKAQNKKNLGQHNKGYASKRQVQVQHNGGQSMQNSRLAVSGQGGTSCGGGGGAQGIGNDGNRYVTFYKRDVLQFGSLETVATSTLPQSLQQTRGGDEHEMVTPPLINASSSLSQSACRSHSNSVEPIPAHKETVKIQQYFQRRQNQSALNFEASESEAKETPYTMTSTTVSAHGAWTGAPMPLYK